MAENTLRVSELDFDTIKQNLKTFYASQAVFSDYVFEGSALSTLIDVLAYNTHYNAIMANMLANEMFLDSAVARGSAISIAKQLDYCPTSYRTATAVVDITVNNPTGNPTSIILPKNSKFTSVIDGVTYTFITLDTYETSPVNGVYKFSGVSLYEGTLKTYSYVVATQNAQNKYIIPDTQVAMDHLTVYVQNSVSDLTLSRFYESRDITQVGALSKVYFVEASSNNLYEVYFGDGVLGASPVNGNIVILEYMTTAGSVANTAKVFKSAASIGGSSSIAISTISAATGGKELEAIDSIKRNAPKAYTAQNRMVTPADVQSLLPILYADIKSVSVWGGEENNPPHYGVVYISIEPKNGGTLTVSQKTDILTNIIPAKRMISVEYKIVDPQYIFLKVDSVAYYDPSKSIYDANALKLIVKNAIATYSNTELTKFEGVFRHSKLSAKIDAADKSIVSNITKFTLHQYLTPVYGQMINYAIDFYNPIYKNEFETAENSVSSSGFRITGDSRIFYLEDDGRQYLRMYYLDNTTKMYTENAAGTVNYLTGHIEILIRISSIIPVNASDSGIQITVKTESFDVIPVRNVILRIREGDITTDAVVDSIASGVSVSGANHTFTSSR
jgi:hypothetical protein